MFCDIANLDGSAFEGDPRQVLKRNLDRARERGFSFYVSPEMEFFYFAEGDPAKPLKVLDNGSYFDLTTADVRRLRELLRAMQVAAARNDPEAWHQANGEFHRVVVHRSGNRLLTRMTEGLWDRSIRHFSGRVLRQAHFRRLRDKEHQRILQSEPLPAEVEARFARLAEESIAKQREIEAADTVPFETFRQQYLSNASLRI